MAKTYNQFYNETNGRGYDIDGYYGAQCWDGAMYYLKWLGYGAISCTSSGYAKDIWLLRKSNGILNYCNEVSVMEPGDVVVFKEVAGWTPYSHIAMFHADAGGGYGWFYGQNQGGAYYSSAGGACFNLCKLPYSATYDTAFRPKCFVGGSTTTTSTTKVIKKSNMTEEHWGLKWTNESPVTIHKDTSDGTAWGSWSKGEELEYTHKGVGNGHRWVGWTEGSQFYVCAISGSETQGKDMWCTLCDPAELAKNKKPTYTVTYNANGGEGAMTKSTVEAGASFKTKKCTFTREGYTFEGWNEKADGTGTKWELNGAGTYESGKSWNYTYTKNITLYAQWRKLPVEEKKDEFSSIKGYGVDISSHNGDFDISPYDFVIIRASYGTVTDEWFEKNVKKCQAANKPFGVYVYDYAYDAEGAIEQADYVMNLVKDTNVPLGIWYDLEDADGFKQKNGLLNREHISKIAKLFCDRCKEKGYYVGVYTTKIWQDSYVNTTYPLWVAHWGTNDGTVQNDFSSFAVMHQYAAYGGIDMDVIYIDYEKMKSNPIKEEVKPVPEEPKTEEPVQKEEIKEPVQEQTPIEETKTESVGILELIRDLFYNLLKLIFGNK